MHLFLLWLCSSRVSRAVLELRGAPIDFSVLVIPTNFLPSPQKTWLRNSLRDVEYNRSPVEEGNPTEPADVLRQTPSCPDDSLLMPIFLCVFRAHAASLLDNTAKLPGRSIHDSSPGGVYGVGRCCWPGARTDRATSRIDDRRAVSESASPKSDALSGLVLALPDRTLIHEKTTKRCACVHRNLPLILLFKGQNQPHIRPASGIALTAAHVRVLDVVIAIGLQFAMHSIVFLAYCTLSSFEFV